MLSLLKRTPEQGAAALLKLTGTAKENFAQAFMQETGKRPSECEMHYGPHLNDHGMTEFRIWFVTKEEAEELRMLRALQDSILRLASENVQTGALETAVTQAQVIAASFPRGAGA